MKILVTLLFSFFLVTSLNAQTYKKIKIFLNNPDQITQLAAAGIDLEGVHDQKEGSVTIFVSDNEFDQVKQLGLSYQVLVEDWDKYYSSLPQMTEAELQSQLRESSAKFGVNAFVPNGSMSGHFTLAELIVKLDSLFLLYPSLISAKAQIGTSIQGRPIYVVKISNSPNQDNGKPEVLYTGLTHAREPGGMMSVLFYMYYLLENYNTNPSVKYLVDNRQMFFVPCVNPDGYYHNQTTNPSGGGMWRKNRRLNTGGTYGVDLNRNYGPFAYWNSALAPSGSSTVPSSDTYRGTAPFSEPEVEAIRAFVTQRKIKTNLNYHTYGQYLIFPYGALARETPDSVIFREYAVQMTGWNGYTYGTDMQTVNYSTRGGSDDFMYSGDTTGLRGKIFGMTPEVGGSSDNFWCPQARIIPIVTENLLPNLFYSWVAGEYVSLQNPNFQQQYFMPGDNVSLKPILKNRGLSTGYNLTTTLTSLSSYATVVSGTTSFDSVQARSSSTSVNTLSFTIAANTPIEQKIKLVVETKVGTISMSKDTVSIITGIPTYTFIDTTNNPLTKWTITGAPTTSPKWDATTTSFYSTPNSYTDSKAGLYVANATVTMTSTNPIDLTGFANPRLSFWTKWEIEQKWDCGVVQISTNNGSTWTTVAGQYTRPASGSGKQIPSGMPMYDAVKSDWVREEMDLTAYGNKQIKLKFELRTDGSDNKDGWYVDDIGVFVYGNTPVELTSFTVNSNDKNISLNWSTATELNNKGFQIERSSVIDGPYKVWQQVAFINGNGTTQQTSDYQFTDKTPLVGKSYYRIKQMDYDGSFRIYGPVETSFASRISFALEQNYPNPFNPSTIIKYSIPENGMVTIKLYNILGSETATLLNEYKEAGRYELNFNLQKTKSQLSSGIYFYTITSGKFTKTMKLVILK